MLFSFKFIDFQIRLHYHQTHLSIVPSEFVLPARSSKVGYEPVYLNCKLSKQSADSQLKTLEKNFQKFSFLHLDHIARDSSCIAVDTCQAILLMVLIVVPACTTDGTASLSRLSMDTVCGVTLSVHPHPAN